MMQPESTIAISQGEIDDWSSEVGVKVILLNNFQFYIYSSQPVTHSVIFIRLQTTLLVEMIDVILVQF